MNSKEKLVVAMINGGVLSVIGEIIVNEADMYILVCIDVMYCLNVYFYEMLTVTMLMTSILGESWGMWMKGREELRQDIIENILKMIMVC